MKKKLLVVATVLLLAGFVFVAAQGSEQAGAVTPYIHDPGGGGA